MFQKDQRGKLKSRAAGDLENRRTEHTPQKCFRCGSEDHRIATFPKPPKENQKRRNQVHFNEKVIVHATTVGNNSDQNIYASVTPISGNDECTSENFGESLQFTNYILDSEATCHMTPQISDFIPGSLEYMDKHIDAVD